MIKNDSVSSENLATHYALQVALQTMKERCQNLQQRLTSVEDENTNLRTIAGLDKPNKSTISSESPTITLKISEQHNEVEHLRDKVAELSRQKVQLTEHIAMVATENRQLWSRLSKLTKDSQTLNKDKEIRDTNPLSPAMANSSAGSGTANNLIRSKTFTQNSPNPMLRHKLPNDFKDIEDENIIGFGYLHDHDSDDATQNIKSIQDDLVELRSKLINQHNELNLLYQQILNQKENLKKQSIVTSTSHNSSNRTISKVDKCLETDPVPAGSISCEERKHSNPNSKEITTNTQTGDTLKLDGAHIELLKQKYKSSPDTSNRMCPMCGKLFTNTFNEFQEHVESHFIDDSDMDYNSIERNFELISSVGDF